MRSRRLLLAGFFLSSLIVALAPLAVGAAERSTRDYLPGDAVMAAGYRVENLGMVFDDFLTLMEMQGEFDPERDMAELRQWEETVGVRLRDDILARVGGEIVAALPVDDHEELLETFARGEPDMEELFLELVFVAGIREPDELDEALGKALQRAGSSLSVDEDGLRTIRGPEEGFPGVFYRYERSFVVAAFSPEAVDRALERAGGKSSLSHAEDFARVLARVGPDPDVFLYFNLPRIRSLLDSSPAVRELIETDPEAAELYERWVERPGWRIGAGWFTYRSAEGTMRTSLFPSQGRFAELVGATPLGAFWGGMGLEMAPLGRILSKLSEASGGGKQRRALSDIRSIGTAIEMVQIDENAYPGPSGGLVEVDTIASLLEPVYISRLPRTDPWGRPYRFWSDGQSYAVVSGGDDGEIQWQPGQDGLGETGAPGADIVFRNGTFVTFPAQ